jgi:hypothetical protein
MVCKKMEKMKLSLRQEKSLGRAKLNYDLNCFQRISGLHTHHATSLIDLLLPFVPGSSALVQIRVCRDYLRHPLPLYVDFVEIEGSILAQLGHSSLLTFTRRGGTIFVMRTTQASSPPFFGPLLFVDGDVRRRDVNRHVQSFYRRWKRKTDAKEMRASVKIPHRPASTKFRLSAEISNNVRDFFVDADPMSSSSAESASSGGSTPFQTKNDFTLPVTLLREGNSDPFSAFAVPVTPMINLLMSYARDYYLPALNREFANPGVTLVTNRTLQWENCVRFLHDKCTAYAYLAQVSAAFPRGRSFPNFTAKAIEELRERLARSSDDRKTHHGMLLLLSADVYNGNSVAAKHHGMMLAQLLRGASVSDSTLIFRAIFNDSQGAMLSLGRPSFDVEWVSRVFDPVFKYLVEDLEEMSVVMDSSIYGMSVCRAFINIRRCLSVFFLGLKDAKYASPAHMYYVRYLVTAAINELLHCFVDARSQVEAYASLAGIVFIRATAGIDRIHVCGDFYLWDVNDMLLGKMKGLIEVKGYSRVKLWALYVGACVEQARGKVEWYNVRLAEHVRGMGLVTWREVREVLMGFLYTDILKPHGSEWFAGVMGVG